MKHVILRSLLFGLNIGILTKAECNNTHPDQNGKFHCCTNFFLNNKECKECPSGLFGQNCSSKCQYPSYGRLCTFTCQCDNTTCDPFMGCTTNESMDTTNDTHPHEISIPDSTPFTNKSVSSINKEIITMVEINRVNKQKSSTQLKTAVIYVGSFLISMIVICAIIWVSMSLCKKRTIKIPVVNEDNDVASVYMEIDDGSNHIESQVQILNRTELDESCITLDETTEDRPELPARMTFVFSSDDDALTSCSNTDEILRTDNENVSVV